MNWAPVPLQEDSKVGKAWRVAFSSSDKTPSCLYRDSKQMQILLSNGCLVLPAVVKQQQEEISPNHASTLFALSVLLGIPEAVK